MSQVGDIHRAPKHGKFTIEDAAAFLRVISPSDASDDEYIAVAKAIEDECAKSIPRRFLFGD